MDARNITRNAIMSLIQRKQGTRYFIPRTMASQRRTEHITVDLLTLPHLPGAILQDWDTESENFGQFFPMVDYDPVPE